MRQLVPAAETIGLKKDVGHAREPSEHEPGQGVCEHVGFYGPTGIKRSVNEPHADISPRRVIRYFLGQHVGDRAGNLLGLLYVPVIRGYGE